ncbi:hypothetical protein ACWOCD_18125 [Enterococcus silesiacus]|nr:hypothetical protein [Enterococcus silesiacus]
MSKEELVEVLNNYSSTFHRIEKSIKKKEDSKLTKFRKNVLPYFVFLSLTLSGLSLWWSFKIYNLGEQYKKSLNSVSLTMDFIHKGKISNSLDDPYLTLDPYDRYPITYQENSGETSEKYLFKYNIESNTIEPIKLNSRTKDETNWKLSISKNSKAKDLQAYIKIKNTSGVFEDILDTKYYSPEIDENYWKSKDEILCIFDPSFVSPKHEYIGIYCLAIIGKNEQSYLTTFITSYGEKIEDRDYSNYFDGIDIFDEYKWSNLIEEKPKLENIKDAAHMTYEKSLQFLKNMR